MPYTSHGYWYGPGRIEQPAPDDKVRCSFGLCPECQEEAGDLAAKTDHWMVELGKLTGQQFNELCTRLRAEGIDVYSH
ncbi:hypothetical protein [Nonomuraea endophytica]|uniref:hypothetical protein n=1 Tax=Nonomuraea endophytica TaxID=714136 RepID=UPI0037CBDF4D